MDQYWLIINCQLFKWLLAMPFETLWTNNTKPDVISSHVAINFLDWL